MKDCGKEDERFFLTIETVSIFEPKQNDYSLIDENDLQKECVSKSLTQLRKTVREVTAAYGRKPLDLPVFDDEKLCDE